ncbi:glutathionylspermidine synthase family protein [Bacillus sp. 31A1R]|uniref:Glutathionylspermidine synthase family protein n=1 Tax=Robertmurraya mangrovi TaxID=3098077 RepID=A0ABU5IWY4_9BACI|nr:glutathionylspermidine synthase family protein [Bacillus sp. 31A1R]MDZ5471673.1 glutathionylspermidine synthase family protein [Bacillus sp. 31A1R]
MKDNVSFIEKRKTFYETIPNFWHDLFEEEYALFDIKLEKREKINQLRVASNQIWRIFKKTVPLIRELKDETLVELGFPVQTLPYVRILSKMDIETVIGRFDFSYDKGYFKLLEFNADTPTFIKETFSINQFVCDHFKVKNPNRNMEKDLAFSIRKAVVESTDIENPKVVFTSHRDHEEDYLTTRYLLEISGVQNAEYIALSDLHLVSEPFEESDRVMERGLYTPNGEKIDVLYRQTYPLEHLIEDRDPSTGEYVGKLLLDLVKEGRLTIINPPSAFLLQSKAIQALIWGLHENGHSYFTEEEHHVIQTYFLPTYLDPDYFYEKKERYVKKPSFGREGDTIVIYEGTGEKILEDKNKNYEESLAVFQKFTELEPHLIQTEKGHMKTRVMYGCFIISSKASAVGIRAGGQITDNTSYFLPIGEIE